MLPQVTDEGYREFIQRHPYAILVLDAPWNGNGGSLKERAKDVAARFIGLIAIGEVNVDNASEIVEELKPTNVPTIAFYRAGKVVGFLVGASQDLSRQAESLIAGEQVKYIHAEDLTIQTHPNKRHWFRWLFSWICPTSK
jgi:thioredoxin-like negative regulator of GroEL